MDKNPQGVLLEGEEVEGLSTTLVPIPDERQNDRGWRVFINGEELSDPVQTVDIINPEYGWVRYGDDPSHGFDTCSICEPGGGGQQTLPFAIIGGKLRVGVIAEWRRNHDGIVLNAPRGWKITDRTHRQSAEIEGAEEIGVEEVGIKLFEQAGQPVNWNSAWVVTTPDEEGEEAGFEFFAFEVREDDLYIDTDGLIVFKDATEPPPTAGGRIYRCRFIAWQEAMDLQDGFTVIGVGRLIKKFIAEGRINTLLP